MADWILLIVVVFLVVYVALALKTIRPTDRGLIERFGKYNRFGNPGLVWIIPFVERLIKINITEMTKPPSSNTPTGRNRPREKSTRLHQSRAQNACRSIFCVGRVYDHGSEAWLSLEDSQLHQNSCEIVNP